MKRMNKGAAIAAAVMMIAGILFNLISDIRWIPDNVYAGNWYYLIVSLGLYTVTCVLFSVGLFRGKKDILGGIFLGSVALVYLIHTVCYFSLLNLLLLAAFILLALLCMGVLKLPKAVGLLLIIVPTAIVLGSWLVNIFKLFFFDGRHFTTEIFFYNAWSFFQMLITELLFFGSIAVAAIAVTAEPKEKPAFQPYQPYQAPYQQAQQQYQQPQYQAPYQAQPQYQQPQYQAPYQQAQPQYQQPQYQAPYQAQYQPPYQGQPQYQQGQAQYQQAQYQQGQPQYHQPQGYSRDPKGFGYIDMAAHVLLSLFTFGIWTYIWIYKTTRTLSGVPGEQPQDPTAKLLLCMFVPFYMFFWLYNQGKRAESYGRCAGVQVECATMCLVFAFFFPLVSYILLQSGINKAAEAMAR